MEGVQHKTSGVQHEISTLEANSWEVEEEIKGIDQLIDVAANAEEMQRYEERWDRLRDKEKELHEEEKALRRKESSRRRKQSGIVMAWIFISKGLVAARILISKGLLAARNFNARGLGATWLLILRVLKGVLNARASISTAPLLISSVLTNPPTKKPVASVRSSGFGTQADHFGYKSIGQEPQARSKETLEIVYDAHIEIPDNQRQELPLYEILLDKRVNEIQERLKNGVLVGIFGMGGIGKTVLAKRLYKSISFEYEYTCFVDNVKVIPRSLDEVLRRQFYRNGVRVGKEFGIEWDDLRGKKTLIVMDDVDSEYQLRVLPGLHCFGNGSHLIITGRDQHILNFFPQYVVYEVDLLDVDEAKKLFCHHVGIEEISMPDHIKKTLKLIIDKCGGLPLTLEVVGRYLRSHGNDAKFWEETLEKLGRASSISGSNYGRIWPSLRVSYDALLETEQEMFIEAGTFFFGQQLEHALVAWKTRYNHAESSWANLVQRSLVKTIRRDKWDPTFEREIEYWEIWVHEYLRDMAKVILEGDIVSGSDGGSDTRKVTVHTNWVSSLVITLVEKCEIELPFYGAIEFRLKVVRMSDLYPIKILMEKSNPKWRVHADAGFNGNGTMLQLDLPEKSEELKYIDLDGVVDECLGKNFPNELVLLKWKMRSIAQLPLISLGKMKHLALLEVENWSVRKFFCEALGNLTELRILSLCSLEGLDGLPETFGELSFLEDLTLKDVGVLELPKSFGNLSSLVTLKIRGCSELSSLPDSFGLLSSLEELYIYDCPKLSILGESFGHLQRLKYLSLKRCESIEKLPASFKDLQALKELMVDGCSSIQGLSDDLSHIKTLARLTVQGGVPKEVLSGNFWSLPALKYLSLKHCWNLEGLPPILDLPFLEELELEGCNGLQGLPENLHELISFKRLVIKGAYSLKVLPDGVGRVSSLREIILSDCNGLRSLPRSLQKPFSINDQATELGKTTDKEGVRLAITECDFLKDEILRRGFVYKKGYWYPKRRHR